MGIWPSCREWRVPWGCPKAVISTLVSCLSLWDKNESNMPAPQRVWYACPSPWCWEDRRQEEKWTTEDEMVGWHHQLEDMSLTKLWEMVKDREAWRAAVHGVTKSRTWLSEWTTAPLQPENCYYKKLSWLWVDYALHWGSQGVRKDYRSAGTCHKIPKYVMELISSHRLPECPHHGLRASSTTPFPPSSN